MSKANEISDLLKKMKGQLKDLGEETKENPLTEEEKEELKRIRDLTESSMQEFFKRAEEQLKKKNK